MSPTPVKEKSPDITNSYSIIAENFLVLPGIARDLSAIVSGVIGIVKQKGGEVKEGPDESFIAEKDFQGAKKLKKPTQIVEESKKKKGGIGASIGGGIGSFASALLSPKKLMAKFAKMAKNKFKKIMVNLGKNLMRFAKKIFSPKNIMKVLGKIALPVLIVSTLWVALSSAFEKWKETGSIWEAYKESVGSVIEFLTLGFIDKETIKNLYQGAADFLMPVVPAIQEFFGKFSNWVGDKFSAVLKLFGINIKPKEAPKETPQKEQVVTPDILKGKEQAAPKEKDAHQQAADLLSKPVTMPAEPPPAKAEVQPAAPTPAPTAAAPTPAPTAAPAGVAPSPAPATAPDKKPEGIGSGGKFSKEGDFVSSLKPWAEYVSKAIGGKVPPFAILGQWAGESGSGKSLPADYNYAGIKAGTKFQKGDFVPTEERYTDKQLAAAEKSGETLIRVLGPDDKMKKSGRSVTVDEWYGKGNWQKTKDEGKNWVQVKSYFAKFKDLKDFADSFAGFISSPRYAKAREQTTASGFGFEIAKAGYATASAEKYSAKVAAFDSKYSGSQIASASNSVAVGQREQQKPTTPVVINKPTTNNTNVNTTQLASAPKDKTTGSNMVLARAA